MNNKDIVFWGAASQAVVLEELIGYSGSKVVAVFDNNTDAQSPVAGAPIFYKKAGFEQWIAGQGNRELYFAVAIAGIYGDVRLEMHDYLNSFGLKPFQCVHPSSFIASNATIGEGCHILAKAVVCARSTLGKSVILNTLADVDHECVVEDGAHISANVIVAGRCTIKSNAFVGIGAAILPGLTIGRNAIVGAGAVITKDVPDNAVAYGNPASVRYYRDAAGQRIEVDEVEDTNKKKAPG